MSKLTTVRWHAINTPMPWNKEVNDALLALLDDKLGFASPGAPAAPITSLPPAGMKAKIALCLGHGRPVDEGNVGAGGISEEMFNMPIIARVAKLLHERGIASEIICFYPCVGYEEAMHWLAGELVARDCTAAVEFHFNAFDGKAQGHEVLHWEKSKRGITLARSINDALTSAFPDRVDRGIKAKNHRDRGALFLSFTHCPACIAEPFFGDNPEEWENFSDDQEMERLSIAYADGIERWLESTEVTA